MGRDPKEGVGIRGEEERGGEVECGLERGGGGADVGFA